MRAAASWGQSTQSPHDGRETSRLRERPCTRTDRKVLPPNTYHAATRSGPLPIDAATHSSMDLVEQRMFRRGAFRSIEGVRHATDCDVRRLIAPLLDPCTSGSRKKLAAISWQIGSPNNRVKKSDMRVRDRLRKGCVGGAVGSALVARPPAGWPIRSRTWGASAAAKRRGDVGWAPSLGGSDRLLSRRAFLSRRALLSPSAFLATEVASRGRACGCGAAGHDSTGDKRLIEGGWHDGGSTWKREG
jgi:hypothetical protein